MAVYPNHAGREVEVIKTNNEANDGVPAVTKQLVGHVDNSSYPQITVDTPLSLCRAAFVHRTELP